MVDRRQFLTGTIGGWLGSLMLPHRSHALQAAARQAAIVPLTERLSLVTSGETNVLARSTRDGLVLVDSGVPARADQLADALGTLPGGGRVSTIFSTHWHAENTGANELLGAGGAAIVAHENTRLWMATPTWIPGEDRYRAPRSRTAHPTNTFYTSGTMTADGEPMEYGYLLEAHTSGDIYVFFRESNVLAVGDVASPSRDPELDWFTGAWLGGRVDAMDRLLSLANDATRIVPGYGPVMTRTELKAERDVMATIYERVVDRVREGDSVDDMLGADVMNGLPRVWMDPRTFLHDVHKGLWAHHNKLAPNVV